MDRGRNREAEEQSVEGPVPMHPLLAEFLRAWKEQTMYSRPTEWVFASTKCKGQQPRVTNMLVEDYLRPAAVKAGVLKSKKNEAGELVDDDPRRFGFHNLRHSLASFLVRSGTDIKTVQNLLRHASSKVTIDWYLHKRGRRQDGSTGQDVGGDSQQRSNGASC